MLFSPASTRGWRALGAGFAALVLLLSGCAGQFVGIPGQDDIAAPVVSSKSAADKRTSTPSQVSTDLWGRIRSGLQLRDDNQPAVRELVTFYSARKKHLRDSALRAQPYLHHIVDNVEARNMPMEIALLPLVESSYDPFAGGGQRASGLWQFMPITAQRFGLTHSNYYEGRRDVLLSTRAALDYLGWLHARFDNWLLALAAYNAGEGTLDKAIAAARARGGPTDFWHLQLPAETERYIPKLLALSELLAQPKRFGITWPSVPDTPAFVAVELPALTALETAANMMDVSVKRLRTLNPALRGNTTRPDGPHVLLVPADRAEHFQAELAKLADPRRLRWLRHKVDPDETLSQIADDYDINLAKLKQSNGLANNQITIGQNLWIPKIPAPPKAPVKPAPRRHYRVAPGDSLWAIAHQHKVSVTQLRRWNKLTTRSTLHPGQVLTLYGTLPAQPPRLTHYTVRSGDSLWSIARQFDTHVATLQRLNSLGPTPVIKPGQTLVVDAHGPRTVYYRVRQGDSLWSIATRYQVQIDQLQAWNSLSSDGLIQPGQKLKILVDTTG